MYKLTAAFPQNLSIRFMVLIVLAVMGMALTQVAWRGYQDTREEVMGSNEEIMEFADSVAVHQQRMIDRVSHLLGALGGISIGQGMNTSQCENFLTRQLDSFPEYDNIAYVGTDGVVQCSAHPLSRIFFPSIPLLKGAISNKPLLLPMGNDHLLFAMPHWSSEGKAAGTVVALLPASRFFVWSGFHNIRNAAIGLIDGGGDIITAYPSFERWKDVSDHNPLFSKSLFQLDRNSVVRLTWSEGMKGTFIAKPLSGFANGTLLVIRSPADGTGIAFTRSAAILASVVVITLLILGVLGNLVAAQLASILKNIDWKQLVIQPEWKKPFEDVRLKAMTLARGLMSRLRGAGTTFYPRVHHDSPNASIKLEGDRVRQIVRLDQLSQGLQGCVSTAEVAEMVAKCAQEMFPHSGGALLLKLGPDLMETIKAWGGSSHQEAFRPNDCWALRTGKPYQVFDASGANCAHLKGPADNYICMPLIASGELLGVLHLAGLASDGQSQPESMLWSAKSIAERVAISISTVRQQERLRFRATRDVLTGLFNRRFMEEAMEIEQRRALRRGSPIGFMMLDVDHFKHLNDSFGHDAGDAVLRMIGSLLRHIIREGDMPCRYGGEEFVVILPGASLEDTHQRAETLRMAIERYKPNHEGRALGQVTVSIGVAVYPGHGTSWQKVLKSADQALYNAKRSGRNRVVSVTKA